MKLHTISLCLGKSCWEWMQEESGLSTQNENYYYWKILLSNDEDFNASRQRTLRKIFTNEPFRHLKVFLRRIPQKKRKHENFLWNFCKIFIHFTTKPWVLKPKVLKTVNFGKNSHFHGVSKAVKNLRTFVIDDSQSIQNLKHFQILLKPKWTNPWIHNQNKTRSFPPNIKHKSMFFMFLFYPKPQDELNFKIYSSCLIHCSFLH